MISYSSSPSRSIVGAKKRAHAYRYLWEILSSVHRTQGKTQQLVDNLIEAGLMTFSDFGHLTSESAYEILKHGVPSRSLDALSDYLGVGKGDVAALVDLDRTTAFRKTSADRPLPMHAAETVLRLLELTSMAEDTFETPEDAAQWLRRAHPMLNGETPLELAKSGYGAERVKEILIALKYGGAV